MARSKVVLPQPEGPRKQTNSPSPISSVISPRAVKSPKRFERLRTSRYDMPVSPRSEALSARAAGGEGGDPRAARGGGGGLRSLQAKARSWEAPPHPPMAAQ